MKIEDITIINGATLMVYAINISSYKYTILAGDSSIYAPNELYYTAAKAQVAARESIRIMTGC
ncbi:hypothetical protein NIES4102_06990 [Chondrocystis sp. NIES-4102]|nr:hypothetical protein NIES4102_06990 [Chondrocystis sp. NIES-4102]